MSQRDDVPFRQEESADTLINYVDLAEAIIEREIYGRDHDEQYLALRIHLIAERLGIKFEDSRGDVYYFLQPLKDLISGVTKQTTHLLPEDRWGLLEGPLATTNLQAYDVVKREMQEEYEQTQVSLEAINEMYVTYTIFLSIPVEMRQYKFPISEL